MISRIQPFKEELTKFLFVVEICKEKFLAYPQQAKEIFSHFSAIFNIYNYRQEYKKLIKVYFRQNA